MLGTTQASAYFTHLLRFNERNIQLVVSNGTFLLLHPVVQGVHPITYLGNRPSWLLDYLRRDVRTVVSQRLWSPSGTADAQRYSTVPLNMPIFLFRAITR